MRSAFGNIVKIRLMSSIFKKIIDKEIPCYLIAEDENFLAFLDINPNALGHTLCIPKKEVDKLFDLPDDLYLGLMAFSKKVAIALEKTVPCNRVGMAVIGLEVPHAHIHLIPLNEMGEMSFRYKVNVNKEEMENLVKRIQSNL